MITRRVRKILAVILLFLLIVVPFVNWRLGAVLWMSAWLVFIFQNLFQKKEWKIEEEDGKDDEGKLEDVNR